MKIYIFAFLVLTGGCASSSQTLSTVSPVTMESIQGEWSVNRFNDYKPADNIHPNYSAAFVNIRDELTSFYLGCNFSTAALKLDAESKLVIYDRNYEPEMSAIGCKPIERQIRDQEIFEFMNSDTARVEIINNEKLRIHNEDHELILIRKK